MAEGEKMRVKDLGQDFQGRYEARPWPVEEVVAVDEVHAPLPYGLQVGPAGMPRKHTDLLIRSLQPEATGHHHDDVGVGPA